MYRVYKTMNDAIRKSGDFPNRIVCNFCGKTIADGEDFVATRYYNKKTIGWYQFKHFIHTKHLDKDELEKWKMEDLSKEI